MTRCGKKKTVGVGVGENKDGMAGNEREALQGVGGLELSAAGARVAGGRVASKS